MFQLGRWDNFTTNDCERMDNVFCDEEGYVKRLEIYEAVRGVAYTSNK
jgi:hypothetical protein